MAQTNSSNHVDETNSFPRKTFLGLFAANAAAMLGMGILLPLLSPLAKQLGATETVVGAIFAGFALGRGICSPVFGRISDRYGRKKLMFVGLIFYAALAIGYILLHSLLLLAVLWFFQGVSSAMVAPIAQSYVGDIVPAGKEGRLMNLFYIGQFGGIAVGPIAGGFLTDHVSVKAPFYVMLASSFIALGLVYFAVPWQPASQRENQNGDGQGDSFIKVLKDRKMTGIISYMVGRGFYRWGFNSFFPIYAITIASLSKSQVGIVITAYMLAGALLQYPSGRLADYFPNRRGVLITIGGCFSAVTMFIVPLLQQMIWLIVLVIGMGVFSALARASTVAIRTERGRFHGMGAVTGVYMSSFSAGQVLGPLGFGAIADVWNIPTAFYIGGIAGLATTGVAFWYLWHQT
jgi:DHA1 family multidrug resistance protein-like MFS transporter